MTGRSEPDGFAASSEDRARVDHIAGSGASGYGEITPEGARRLLRWLQPTERDVLFDLGSGVGGLVLQAARTTAVGRAVGVELSVERHEGAVRALDAACESLGHEAAESLRRRVVFRHEDLRAVDLSDATLVYLGATCFPPPLVAAAARRIVTGAPRLRRLLTTRRIPATFASSLTELGELTLPMTWAASERVYAYGSGSEDRA